MEPIALSYSEAGKVLGGASTPLSRTAIWRLVRAGELEKFNVGQRALISVESIKRFIDCQRKAA